jgi:hypothetical protein
MLTDNVNIWQIDHKLMLSCRHSHMWFGCIFLAASLHYMYFSLFDASQNNGIKFWIGLIVTVCFFIPFGLFLALPRYIKTTFDLHSRVMEHRTTYAGGLYERRLEVPFTQIEGVGLQEYENEGFSYAPVAKLRNGKRLSFATSNGGYVQYQDVIATVSAETGLAILALPAQRT